MSIQTLLFLVEDYMTREKIVPRKSSISFHEPAWSNIQDELHCILRHTVPTTWCTLIHHNKVLTPRVLEITPKFRKKRIQHFHQALLNTQSDIKFVPQTEPVSIKYHTPFNFSLLINIITFVLILCLCFFYRYDVSFLLCISWIIIFYI
jgi:hypothetical protein